VIALVDFVATAELDSVAAVELGFAVATAAAELLL